MVGSRVTIIDPDGDALTEMGDALSHEHIVTNQFNYKGPMVYHPAVIYRRKAVLDLGGYRPDYPEAEDLDLFLRLAEVGQIVNLPEPLLKYRNHPAKAGISRRRAPLSLSTWRLVYCALRGHWEAIGRSARASAILESTRQASARDLLIQKFLTLPDCRLAVSEAHQ